MALDEALRQIISGERAAPDPAPVAGVQMEATTFAGPHGPIPVRIYRSDDVAAGPAAAAAPGLVWNHGGGWIGGDLDMIEADGVARRVAAGLAGVVVSVDYRLAPAHTFPVPLDDVVAAFNATASAAAGLGIDPARLALGGASAGAHLSALATARLRGEALAPAALLLVYPATDPANGPYGERPEECPPQIWFTRDATLTFFGMLLGEGADTDNPPPETVPAAGDLSHLPPTLVTTAGYDGLAPQAIRYVELVKGAGGNVTHFDEPGLLHGYLNMVGQLAAADAALNRYVDWLRAAVS